MCGYQRIAYEMLEEVVITACLEIGIWRRRPERGSQAPDSANVALEEMCKCTRQKAWIFLNDAARQIVALEVTGQG